MAICYPMHKVEEKTVVKVKVPTGVTLKAGQVVLAETLNTDRSDNFSVYDADQVADITADFPCIIINQGFEELTDGRRPSGQPNPSKFEYNEGEVLTAIRLEKDYKFYIGDDVFDNTGVVAPAVDVKLIPQNADYELATSATFGTAVAGLNIEKLKSMPVGGQFGAQFESGVVARVILGR